MNARSVGESSTTMIFLIAIAAPLCLVRLGLLVSLGRAALGEVRLDGAQQAFLREGLGEVFVRAHHAAARAIEQAVLRREHDHRRLAVLAALLDERARLVAVKARHHDVDEDEVGLVVGDLGERVEPVLGEDHLATGLEQEDLRASPDGVAVVDHYHAYAREVLWVRHSLLMHPRRPAPRAKSAGKRNGGPRAEAIGSLQPSPPRSI